MMIQNNLLKLCFFSVLALLVSREVKKIMIVPMEINQKFSIATLSVATAIFLTFVIVFMIIFTLSGFLAVISSFYISSISVIAVFISVLCSAVYFIISGISHYFKVYVSIVIINTILLSWPLIYIPTEDLSGDPAVIIQGVTEVASFTNSVSVIFSMGMLSIIANGIFWYIATKRTNRLNSLESMG